ncbi:MAG: cellulase family glycosylhydrolase, partial [Treponema sp.]|nr:cellulase family glycosylhydrolase [Treponema sp.]
MKRFEGYEKGVDFGGWLSQCSEYTREHYGSFIGEEDFAAVADWGLDHVRLPVDWQVFQKEDGSLIEEGFGYVENAIAWARKNGLRLILDLHKTLGYSFDAESDKNNFFAEEKLQGHFYALWEEFARRFARNEDMLAFELLNEVTSPSYSGAWNKIAANAVRIIRRHSPTVK